MARKSFVLALIFAVLAIGQAAGAADVEVKLDSANGSSGLVIKSSAATRVATIDSTGKITAAGTIESKLGGYKFPDGTVQTTASAGGNYVLDTGDTMTGTLTISATGLQIGTNGLVILPSGEVQTTGVGGGSVVGNTRGPGAVDLQIKRNFGTEVASGNYSVISGGSWNTASGTNSFVGGGGENKASGSNSATVGGGSVNTASGSWATVGGGSNNTAGGNYSVVAGGANCQAGGTCSTVAGGSVSMATGWGSFAAGYYASAESSGAFALADSSSATPFRVNTANVFGGRFVGGYWLTGGNVGIGTTEPTAKLTVVGTIESKSGGYKFPDGTIQITASTGGTSGAYVLDTGDTMTGTLTVDTSAGYSIYGDTSSSTGYGIYGLNSASAGGGTGIFGKGGTIDTVNQWSIGVRGERQASTETYGLLGADYWQPGNRFYYGVYGQTDQSSNAYGVYGYSASTTGGIGVGGRSDSTSGQGVWGQASYTGAATNYGGYFLASGSTARAVYGYADAATVKGTNYGGYFIAGGENARAVYGLASNTAGSETNYGVWGEAEGGTGVGVYGLGNSGTAVGVKGETNASSGYSGYFTGGRGLRVQDGTLEVISGRVVLTTMESAAGSAVGWLAGRLVRGTSSRRYKDNIEPLNVDYNKILNAEPKSYTYKGNGSKDIGYVAEEFEDLGLKELLIYDTEGRPDAIKYDKVPLYLLQIIKDQRKEIAALKARDDALEIRLKAVEERGRN